MEVPANKTTILIVGAGIGGLSFYHSVRKNLGEKFNNVTSLLTDHIGRQLLYKPHQKTKPKNVYEIEPLKHDYSGIVSYRTVLRDVLSEGVDIQWGKKCAGYEESDDGVWALFADGTREFGDLLIGADGINSPSYDPGVTSVTVIPKNLADQLMTIYSNSLIQESLGKNGDFHFSFFRLIPIDQSDEPTYRDNNISIDDNDPESVIKHTISRIRQLRPPCELTDLLIELFSLAQLSYLDNNYPFRTYNPPRRRQFIDVDPLSVPSWKNNRIVLLGDAAHAMNPMLGLGANNAFQDAILLTKELLNYENDNLIECIVYLPLHYNEFDLYSIFRVTDVFNNIIAFIKFHL
ncbi:hypothetical protein C2G38_2061770 [Gigaspora rosea]|uniref:FAD-binding domain-containing protein n=1 Tax=Gigaspora rosea TaxID=44941 RepID=A0A397VYD6_9GLOM|nr:hypothetical protein C2G38_2061770 [Gigaspora rosea]